MTDLIRWTRVEPAARDRSLAAGLAARVHDPLWLLARQRQLGELTADAELGAAVTVELTAEVAPLTRLAAAPYDAGAAPLDALVEAEPVRAAPTARLRATAGLHFLRLLSHAGLDRYADGYRVAYALAPATAPDAASARFLAVVGGRAPDGVRLYADLAAGLPAVPAIATADVAAVRAVATAFRAWFDGLLVEPAHDGGSWIPERMEYAFAAGAADGNGGVSLEADEHTGGRLDWYAFAPGTGEAATGQTTTTGPLTLVPSQVGYPGMPARRFWEFEDAVVDFGGVEAEPADLGRMLLTEFALVFGADWLLVPLEVPLGSLVRIVSLDVRDTFGRTLRVGPTSALDGSLGGWRMFTLTANGAAGPFSGALLVPPVAASALQGRDLEEVLLLRDEDANMAWAVERRVEGENGAAVDRAEVAHAAAPPPARPEPDGVAAYRLATPVPEHWLPLFPERTHVDDPSTGLRLGGASPLGRILRPAGGGTLVLPEEEVPREGARVSRAYRLARWVDGSTHLWLARSKGVGRGEGSSGLRFDSLEDGGSR